jgi:hypothetical protein
VPIGIVLPPPFCGVIEKLAPEQIVSEELAIVAVGLTVTTVGVLIAEQGTLPSEIVTVYDPPAFVVYEEEVALGILVPFNFH